jgi:hypothetical protein
METVGEDTNGVRLAKLDIIMKELSNTIKRIDESNHNVKIQIDAIQDGRRTTNRNKRYNFKS